MPKLRAALAQSRYLPRTLALVWSAARGWTAAWSVLLLLQGLLPVATVYVTRLLVNSLVAAIRGGGGWERLRPALLLVALMAAIQLALQILRSFTAYVRTAQSEKVQDRISALIHGKSAAADMAFYDSAEFYDHLHRARSEASYRPVALVEGLGGLVQNAITLVAMGALVPFGAWVPAALLVGTAPALYVTLRYAVVQNQWRRRVTPIERRAWYYEVAAHDRRYSTRNEAVRPEWAFRIRLSDHTPGLRGERLNLARQQVWAEFGAGTLGLAVTGGVLAWMVVRAVRGLATLGDVAMFYQAFQQGMGLMRGLLESLGQLYGNLLFLGIFTSFWGWSRA